MPTGRPFSSSAAYGPPLDASSAPAPAPALGPVKQAVRIIGWFLGATRPAHLASDNNTGTSTVCTYRTRPRC